MDLNLRDFQRKLFKILLKYICNNQLYRIEFSESMNVAQFFFAFLNNWNRKINMKMYYNIALGNNQD